MEIICNKCGSINDYRTIMKSGQNTAWCNGCDSYIKNIPQNKPKLYFGKYKGLFVHQMTLPEHRNYFNWLISAGIKLDSRTKQAVLKMII